MSTWWKIDKYGCEITPYVVLRETTHFLMLAPHGYWNTEQRVAKSTEFHPTFAAARGQLMKDICNRIDCLMREVERERDRFSKAFLMEPPKETNDVTTNSTV